jgi:NADH-quinone oxidoreductase subunit L
MAAVVITIWKLRSKTLAPASQDTHVESGFWKVLQRKYYVDEIYETMFVRPGWWISENILHKGIDRGLIDGVTVNGFGWHIPMAIGKLGSALQNGRVSVYAWVLLLGAVAVLGAIIKG